MIWTKLKPKNKQKPSIFNTDPDHILEYQRKIKESYRSLPDSIRSDNQNENPTQTAWNQIVKTCLSATAQTTKQKPTVSPVEIELQKLSKTQKDIRNKINTTQNKDARQRLQIQRNRILRQVHKKVTEIETIKTEKLITDIDSVRNSTTKVYKLIRKVFNKQNKKPICIEDKDGLTTDENRTTELITDYFHKLFNKDNKTPIPETQPTTLHTAFTVDEIQKATKTLSNNKSPGIDNITAEHIKYATPEIHADIAKIFNTIADTGQFPIEIKQGLLIPLQKPGKKIGPAENIRPIILLSILRKILATCIINRISTKIYNNIDITQAAYRPGRNTTEHVFTIKAMCEKALTAKDYKTYILLLDMSKAFDTVDRKTLHDMLKDTLDKDELHLTTILLKDVQLQVQNKQTRGETFTTNTGIPQGDCLSALFFILYLAQTLSKARKPVPHLQDHTYNRPAAYAPTPTQTHNTQEIQLLPTQTPPLHIDPQYADDISYITNTQEQLNAIKNTVPDILQQNALTVNRAKTEEYVVSRQGNTDWQTCKYLGSLLDTDKDIDRRKVLANATFAKYKHILTNRRLKLKLRLRLLDTYIKPIFTYNSELWTLTKTLSDKVDAFHRTLLR